MCPEHPQDGPGKRNLNVGGSAGLDGLGGCSFPASAATNHHRRGLGGGRLKTHLFSLGSGGRTSEIKVPEAWAPSASTAGDLTPRPSPAFGGRRQPWASPGLNTQQPDLRLCLFLHLAFPCPLFLGEHQSLDLGAALVQCNLVLTNLQRPYFPTKTAF